MASDRRSPRSSHASPARAARTAAFRPARASGTPASRPARTEWRGPSTGRLIATWSGFCVQGSGFRVERCTLNLEPPIVMSLSCLLMHVSSERLDVLDVSGRQDAMTEVEDVARTAGGALEYFVGRREDASEWSEEERGVEIALNRPVGPDARPCLVERRAPVSADDVAAALPQLAQNRSGADAEMNRGDARPALCCRAGAAGGEAIEDLPDMGQDELSIVGRVQRADPGIEQL